MSQPVVGRFAPTPSGRMHLGNLLCALFSYLSVRKAGGRFLLRIEDVDVPRCPKRLCDGIIEDLQWLGFQWDEPPLYQSKRSSVYQAHLDRLSRQGLIYPCFCTRSQLHACAAPNLGDTQYVYSGACSHLTPEEVQRLSRVRRPSMRLRVPDEDIVFTDGLYGIQRENLARDCGDFILRRSDGLFGYQLAVVVDDALSGVNQVVRGRDILTATPRQIYLLRCLDYPIPEYIHIPLLTDSHGRRLAKRSHDLDLSSLSKQYSAPQLLGMLAFSAGILAEPEAMSLEALIPLFDWKKIKREDIRLPDTFVS